MLDKNADIVITVADKNFKALGNYVPAQGSGKPLTPADIMHKLEEKGVTAGISQETIQKVCESTKPVRNVFLAAAILPVPGEKAHIETYFEFSSQNKAHLREDGSVDFRNLGEIPSATVGQQLYRRISPKLGDPGFDVMGNEIPAIYGKDLKLSIGTGTKIDDNESDLVVASQDGEILVKKGVVHVSQIHTINGDVDFSTGNVKFNGSVKIQGSVKAGFSVTAAGDIEIGENLEDSEIVGDNDVIIHGGLVGSGQGHVQAKRDVIVKFVENQKIDAGRDILVSGEVFHAILRAGRSVVATGPSSMIVGGQCEAKTSVEANKFGSEACTATTITVGTDPKLAENRKNVENEIAQSHEAKEKLEQSIVFLYRQKIDSNNILPPEKQQLLTKLEEAKKALPEKLSILETRLSEYIKQQGDVDKATATASIAVYPKVRVYIGSQFQAVDDTLGPSIFKITKGEIVRHSK